MSQSETSHSTETTRAERSRTRAPFGTVVIPAHVAARAASRFTLDPETGCHISTYSVSSHGYAQVGWQAGGSRGMVTAHRAAWTAAHGRQVPAGMVVDHLCKTRRCVKASHLRVLTNFDNARRTYGRDWPLGGGECINGHPADSYVPGAQTSHSNGFCGECFPHLLWTVAA